MTEKPSHDEILFKCHRKSVQTPRRFRHSWQTQHWLWYDTGMKSKHSSKRECKKNGHIFLVMKKEKEKTKRILVPLPVRSPGHFPTALMSIFRVQCQQHTSSAAPLRPAYSRVLLPDSPLYWGIRSKIVQTQLHNRYRGLMQPAPFMLWPECNSFHGPELECHSTQPCMQVKTNYNIIKPALLIDSWTFLVQSLILLSLQTIDVFWKRYLNIPLNLWIFHPHLSSIQAH